MKENDLPVRLNITYITERIIAMVFPSEGQETTYKSNLTEVSQVLKNKHEDNYLMVNLSERRNDMHRLHKQVIDFGWPEALAPPLERLCNICKSIDSWLNRGRKNVVVIHCKGGMGRLAVVLSAYIDYHNICSNEDQSLDQLSMKQFFETKLCGVIQPSQKRYVHYFAGLLSGAITINNNPLFLHQIVIRGIPNFDGKGGCQPYIKIYQGMKPVYMSGVFSSSGSSNQIIVTLEPCLQLRSDVLVKCYNKSISHFDDPLNREVIFKCQFHTCAVSNNLLKFGKNDLDEAHQDSRFPSHGQVEFVLSDNAFSWNKYDCQPYEKNVLIGTSPESVQRWNSYENFAGLDEDVTFEDLGGYSTERRDFIDQNHSSSKTFRETKSSWKQNVDGGSMSKKSTTSDKWSAADGVERKFNDRGLEVGDVFNANQSRISALKAASSREMILEEHGGHAFRPSIPLQSTTEQQQLDDILKELLEEQNAKVSGGSALAHRYEHAPPSHGTITTEGDKMRTTLSWHTSQAGSTKAATVNRQTLAEPTPHSKLASEVTRYREVTGDEDHIVGGKMTSSENYSCRMPGFQETRKVEMLAESRMEDAVFNNPDQKFLPVGDSYASLLRQKSLNENKFRTYSGRNYASDSEDQLAWLESQRNKLRAGKDIKTWKNKSMQEKQLLAELKSAQGAYYKTKKAQSDSEDLDQSYRRSGHSTDSKMLPLYVQEYRDSKGRRCQTIETETYSKRCETTTNQVSGSQSNAGNVAQKQLMPPPRSSTPSTPVIPDRGESSREAFLRNQYALKPIDYNFDSDARSHASLSRPNLNQIDPSQPVEVEIVSLQPIGPGVQTLEPATPGTGTIQRMPAITYPSQGTLNRDYNMSSSMSVPTSLSNLQPTGTLLKTSISQNLQHPQSHIVPIVPGYQTLQTSYLSDTNRMDGMKTLPLNFTQQPIVQTFKETQTWSTTNTQPNTLQPTALQQLPPQMGGSVQHLNQQQTLQRNMTSSVDGRSVPILVERQERSITQPVGMGQTLMRDSTQQHQQQQQGFVQQQQQYVKQQQQQHFVQQQQPIITRQDFNAGTMRSASSQNQLLVETHSPHMLGASSSSGARYRSLSSGGGGAFFTQQGTGTIRTRADSFSSAAGGEAYEFINQPPKFIKDTSKMWHRPNFTREDATQYLKDKPPGSFVIRNSTTYQGSYGLTLRVAQVPSNVPLSGGDPQLDLVRHFIIEPTAKGVQLKGSANEPPFASLAAFVYQHSITPLSLPCKLLLPEIVDGFESSEFSSGTGSPQLSPSAACNVLYIGSLDTESLTGPEALSRALDKIFNSESGMPKTQEVSFKASAQGITITDNKRRMFFRRHYPLNTITYLGLDNQEQKWAVADFDGQPIASGRVFGFVARKQGNVTDNSCHLFAELDASQQPAQTLISFITQIMVDQGRTVTTTSS